MHEIFDHTADLGVRIRAASLPAVFAEAGEALFAVIAGDTRQVMPRDRVAFELSGSDPGWLLLDWLGELLAAFELRRLLLAQFVVALDMHGLRAAAHGERYDPIRHVLAHEVKAVTQHGFELRQTAAGWEATFVVDI